MYWCSLAVYSSLNFPSASQMELIIFPKWLISARKSFKFIYIERIAPQKPPQKILSGGTLYTWARTKIFWIGFICTLEGCVMPCTYFYLKKVQFWNTLMFTVFLPPFLMYICAYMYCTYICLHFQVFHLFQLVGVNNTPLFNWTH